MLKKIIALSFFGLALLAQSTLARKMDPALVAGQQIPVAIAVENARAFATVPAQSVGAVYVNLRNTSQKTWVLERAQTAVAGSVEIHTMKIVDGQMQMRQLPQLNLPAGKTLKLEQGGLHMMLFDLQQALQAGQTFKLDLHFVRTQGKGKKTKRIRQVQTVDVAVVERQ